MEQRILLGSTKDCELAFGNFELTDKGPFRATFDTVHPFNLEERDIDEEIQYCLSELSRGDLYDLCESYDCAPSALASHMASERSITDFVDCSLYPEVVNVNGEDWMFESAGCGQLDTTGNMQTLVDENSYNLLMDAWKTYHLKQLSNEIYQELVDAVANAYHDFDEEVWIRNYIKNTCY